MHKGSVVARSVIPLMHRLDY